MTYQTTLGDLVSASDSKALCAVVASTVTELIGTQGDAPTAEIHRFMLYHTSAMDTRITSMMKHLAARAKSPIDPTKLPPIIETGLMAGWRSVDNSTQQINHLLVGLPFMYAILITTVTDKLADETGIHSTVGTFTKNDFRAMGTNPDVQTETVSSYKEVSRLFGYLKSLGEDIPINPIKKDPTNTISYANQQYVARWVDGDGSLPRKQPSVPQD